MGNRFGGRSFRADRQFRADVRRDRKERRTRPAHAIRRQRTRLLVDGRRSVATLALDAETKPKFTSRRHVHRTGSRFSASIGETPNVEWAIGPLPKTQFSAQ